MEKRFEDIVAFLLAANLAALIWLTAASSPCEAAQWLTSGLPGWVQGLGTLLAVWIAWKAFSEWRYPELAKARATQAYDVLPKAQSLNTAILQVRTPGRSYGKPVRLSMMKKYLSERRKTNLIATLERAKELAGLSGLILDDRVKADVDALVQNSIVLEENYHLMESLIDDYEEADEVHRREFEGDDFKQESIVGALQIFGCRPREQNNPKPFDEFGREVRERMESLRVRLRRHIQYKHDGEP